MPSHITPVNLFYPSTKSALSIDQAIRKSLKSSIAWCFDQKKLEQKRSFLQPDWVAQPVDFGAYYDLLVTLINGNELGTEAVHRMAQRLSRKKKDGTLSFHREFNLTISTLREPWYSATEVDCLIRWFDIEPDNTMALSPLDESELSMAAIKLQMALKSMKLLLPEFLEEMLAITTEIIFAKPSGQQKLTFSGASSFSLWGALALNAEVHPDWWDVYSQADP